MFEKPKQRYPSYSKKITSLQNEYQEFVKHFITKSKYVYWWLRNLEDTEFMKHKITKPRDAHWWAKVLEQDEDEMK